MKAKSKRPCILCGAENPEREGIFIPGYADPVGIVYGLCSKHVHETGWLVKVQKRLDKRKEKKGSLPANGHYLQVTGEKGLIPD